MQLHSQRLHQQTDKRIQILHFLDVPEIQSGPYHPVFDFLLTLPEIVYHRASIFRQRSKIHRVVKTATLFGRAETRIDIDIHPLFYTHATWLAALHQNIVHLKTKTAIRDTLLIAKNGIGQALGKACLPYIWGDNTLKVHIPNARAETTVEKMFSRIGHYQQLDVLVNRIQLATQSNLLMVGIQQRTEIERYLVITSTHNSSNK